MNYRIFMDMTWLEELYDQHREETNVFLNYFRDSVPVYWTHDVCWNSSHTQYLTEENKAYLLSIRGFPYPCLMSSSDLEISREHFGRELPVITSFSNAVQQSLRLLRIYDQHLFRNDFLLNDYPCRVSLEGITYRSAEAAFDGAKWPLSARSYLASLDGNIVRTLSQSAPEPGGWASKKSPVMEKIVRAKFTQNQELTEKLLGRNDISLMEVNDWDTIYLSKGIDMGKILRKVRKELQQTNAPRYRIY